MLDPAFPCETIPAITCKCKERSTLYVGATGISKREWFAGMALAGTLSAQLGEAGDEEGIVAATVRITDLLIKELEKE